MITIRLAALILLTGTLLMAVAGDRNDSDRDGVADGMDVCKETPSGARIDRFGCALDSDMDGVIDLFDRCPQTPFSDLVDANGCRQ